MSSKAMKPSRRRLSRRALLRSAMAGGAGLLAAYAVGCNNDSGRQPTPPPTRLPAPTPGVTPAPVPTETAPVGLRWRALSPSGPSPSPRRDHSLVADGQRLFLYGGRGNEPLGDLWSFDTNEGTWAEIETDGAPPARFGHNAVIDVARGRMVVFGGQAGSAFFNDSWAFDLSSGRWSELQPGESVPSPRYGAAGAFDPRGRFLISHGFTDAGRFDDTWGFGLDAESWTDDSPQGQRPVERCLVRAVWDSNPGRLLMFGGQTTDTPFLGDLWELVQDGWRELVAEPRPSPRNFYAMAFDGEGGRLVLFGGSTQDGPVNDVWFFDSASDSWSQESTEGEAPSPRFGHDAVWMEGSRSLLVFGGRDGSKDLSDLWELSPSA